MKKALKNVKSTLLWYASLAQCVRLGKPALDNRWPKRGWILGHRGARKLAPENTLSSFRLAMKHGADGVEFDVLLCRDGIPVVIHDETVDRTTDGHGLVCDFTHQQLAELDATKLMEGFTKEGIPTLLEALGTMPDRSIVNVELKGSGHFSKQEFIDKILADLSHHQNRLCIIISSFDGELLKLLRERSVNYLIALLLSKRDKNWPASLKYLREIAPDALNLSPDLATPITRILARAAHMRVALWTINNSKEGRRWLSLGIEGIFTDIVPEMVTSLRR